MLKNFLKFIKLHTRLIVIVLVVSLIGLFVISKNKGETTEKAASSIAKEVEVYSPSTSYIESIGQIVEGGRVEIKSQVGGVVNRINAKPGQVVYVGTNILEISQAYGSSSPAITQAKIADAQYQLAKENFDNQAKAIEDQKKLAELNSQSSEEQRKIAEASLNDTNKLVENAESSLEDLKAANVAGSLDSAISSLEASLAQLKASQRNLSFAASDNPVSELSKTSLELTQKQLAIQQNSLEVQLEIARLSATAAHQSAASFMPQSPVSGKLEAILVGENQVVSPGQTLAVISTNSNTKIVTSIPESLYQYFDQNTESVIDINGQQILTIPTFVSEVATNGFLHTVHFEIDSDYVYGSDFVRVKLPFVTNNHSEFLAPLESLHQTQNNNYLYVLEGNQVISKEVTIGSIQGSFVEILAGVESKEKIITTRNVAAGDIVTITN